MDFNKIVKPILVIAALALISLTLYFTVFSNKTVSSSESTGEITILLTNEDKELIKRVETKYYEGDTLVKLVDDTFDNVRIEDGMILDIEDYKTPEDFSTYLFIYVDGTESSIGISQIELSEHEEVEFRITKGY